MDLIVALQDWVDTLPVPLQVFAIAVIGMIPFLEGDVAATVGGAGGVHWVPAIVMGAAGTIVTIVLALGAVGRVGERREGPWREHRVMRRVEQWGAPIAMLVSGFLLSVPVAAFVMRAAGMRRAVILPWALVSAVVNAVFAGLLAAGILALLLG